jgi:hypothetical protein
MCHVIVTQADFVRWPLPSNEIKTLVAEKRVSSVASYGVSRDRNTLLCDVTCACAV